MYLSQKMDGIRPNYRGFFQVRNKDQKCECQRSFYTSLNKLTTKS